MGWPLWWRPQPIGPIDHPPKIAKRPIKLQIVLSVREPAQKKLLLTWQTHLNHPSPSSPVPFSCIPWRSGYPPLTDSLRFSSPPSSRVEGKKGNVFKQNPIKLLITRGFNGVQILEARPPRGVKLILLVDSRHFKRLRLDAVKPLHILLRLWDLSFGNRRLAIF